MYDFIEDIGILMSAFSLLLYFVLVGVHEENPTLCNYIIRKGKSILLTISDHCGYLLILHKNMADRSLLNGVNNHSICLGLQQHQYQSLFTRKTLGLRQQRSVDHQGKILQRREWLPPHYSYLENSKDRGACWATVNGVAKSQTYLNN